VTIIDLFTYLLIVILCLV